MLYNIKLSLPLQRVFHGIRFYISKKAVGMTSNLHFLNQPMILSIYNEKKETNWPPFYFSPPITGGIEIIRT